MKPIDKVKKHFESLPPDKRICLQDLRDNPALRAEYEKEHPGELAQLGKTLGYFVVSVCRDYFLLHKNPLCVWEAYQLCRKYEIKVPSWILEYFDGSAKNLMDICEKSDTTKAATKLPKALGFNYRKNQRSSFFYFEDLQKQIDIYCQVEELTEINGLTVTAALEQVADKKNISYSSVSEKYYRFYNKQEE